MSFLRRASVLTRAGVVAASTVAALASLAGVLAGASTGCTIVYKTDKEQCFNDGDCSKFGGFYCRKDLGVCEPKAGYCTTNAECIERNPDAPHICRKDQNRCVKLVIPTCNGIIGDINELKKDDTVVLGFVNNYVNPTYAPIGVAQRNAVQLALQDLMKNTPGLPPRKEGEKNRGLVWVSCDGTSGPLADTFNFLIDEVKVPAIHGPAFSGDVITISGAKTLSSKTLIISPSAGSAAISSIASRDPRLIWRTVPSDALNAKVISTVVPNTVEPELKGSGGTVKPGTAMKVAVVHKGDAFGLALRDSFFQQLRFNGLSAADNLANGNYQAVTYGEPGAPNAEAAYARAVSEVLSASKLAHLIIFVGTAELIPKVFEQIERGWSPTAEYRPKYMFATAAAKTSDLLDRVYPGRGPSYIGTPNLRARIIGTEAGTQSTLFRQFQSNYGSSFGQDAAVPGFYAAAAYDAAYLLTYAVAAVGSAPLNGENIARGLERLVPDGLAINVGDTSAFNAGFFELSQGRHINLTGATGPLDFNITTGDADTDMQVWCMPSAAASFVSSGLYYNSSTGSVTGNFNCP
ncbi:hypothetical protein [Pendulispora albinea]|uniref:Uncharacterized protein n=1 Tax=Pendulispora albinea TaxID=2741071 RepID=A0ABZ2MAH1_9BACT